MVIHEGYTLWHGIIRSNGDIWGHWLRVFFILGNNIKDQGLKLKNKAGRYCK